MSSLRFAQLLCLALLVASLHCSVLVSAWQQQSVNGKVHDKEPDVGYNHSCNTGSCSVGGYLSYYGIPLAVDELGYNSTDVSWHEVKNGSVGDTVRYAYRLKDQDVLLLNVQSVEECCTRCKFFRNCTFWQFVRVACGDLPEHQCYLYSKSSSPQFKGPNRGVAPSIVGAKCNTTVVSNDPHLVGAHGTRFDFNGIPNESYCLITDRRLQINMKMAGYFDTRTEGASHLTRDGKVVRTWIRELGIVWNLGTGKDLKQHKLLFAARAGSSVSHNGGYLAVAELDGKTLPKMTVGVKLVMDGGLTIRMGKLEKFGSYDVEVYHVNILGLLDMEMRLRAANPQLRTIEEAYVHISVGFSSLNVTTSVHGILGQTYRDDHENRAVEFSAITSETLRPIAADSEEGKGFLDGKASDYIVNSVLHTQCLYSAYNVTPSIVSSTESRDKIDMS